MAQNFFRDTTNSGVVIKPAPAEAPVIGHIDSVSIAFRAFLSVIELKIFEFVKAFNCVVV